MARLNEIEDAELYGADGAHLGTVERVLFHPSEPCAVALMVRPDPAFSVVKMPVAYVAWSAARLVGPAVRIEGKKLPSRRATEALVGHDMDLTVIWRGMPVTASDGATLGSVAGVTLAADGSVERLEVSGGAIGDVANGRAEASGDAVTGFDGSVVRLSVPESALVTSGGLARKAAETSEAVKAKASTMAGATGDAIVDASYITGRAIRSAAGSEPVKRTKATLKGIADAFREGYKDSPPE
ncbi:MAG: hypothetical protein Q7W16_08255 [Coriobacteriia bacterium]|nr:hypothetical protein [Coriobacteriia bacterium]